MPAVHTEEAVGLGTVEEAAASDAKVELAAAEDDVKVELVTAEAEGGVNGVVGKAPP